MSHPRPILRERSHAPPRVIVASVKSSGVFCRNHKNTPASAELPGGPGAIRDEQLSCQSGGGAGDLPEVVSLSVGSGHESKTMRPVRP